jgi:hypothetical protein
MFANIPPTATVEKLIEILEDISGIIIVTRKKSYELYYDIKTENLISDLLNISMIVEPDTYHDSEQKQLSRIVANNIKRSGTTNLRLINILEANASDEVEEEVNISEILMLTPKSEQLILEDTPAPIITETPTDIITSVWDELLDDK